MEILPEGDCTVNAYAVETRQVLLNLVRNAVEASSRSGGKVTVSLEGRSDDVRVVVEDRGTGISPDLMPRLFQFGASTKGEHGNGMGLWLAKQLVSRHGGTIEAESTPGEGSRFTVLWPRKIPETSSDRTPTAAGAAI
jgi:signal transduction histidine kinase